MKNLLLVDIRNVRRNKLSLIALLIAAILPFFIVLLYLGIREMMHAVGNDPNEAQMMDALFSAKGIIGGTFSFSSNVGIVLPIFSGILVGLDVSSGTIRNKVIMGCARSKIYASHLLTSCLFNVAIIGVYAASTALFSLLFFPYGPNVGQEEILSLVFFYVLGFLGFVFIASASTFYGLITGSMPATVLLTVATGLGLGIITAIISAFDYSAYKYAFYLIPCFSQLTFSGGNIELPAFLEGMGSYLVFISLFTVLGFVTFGKKDLK